MSNLESLTGQTSGLPVFELGLLDDRLRNSWVHSLRRRLPNEGRAPVLAVVLLPGFPKDTLPSIRRAETEKKNPWDRCHSGPNRCQDLPTRIGRFFASPEGYLIDRVASHRAKGCGVHFDHDPIGQLNRFLCLILHQCAQHRNLLEEPTDKPHDDPTRLTFRTRRPALPSRLRVLVT